MSSPAAIASDPGRALGHDPGALAGVLDWVDPRLGRIRSVGGLALGAPEPRWWIYTCALSRPLGRFFAGDSQTASGASTSGSEALRRALGEAVERWVGFGSIARADLQPIAAGDNPLLASFPRCADDEPCPPAFKRIPPAQRLLHTPMRRLSDGRAVQVPAGWVHLGFRPPAGEPPIVHPISTGLAFHLDLPAALWSGLCEVAERDAVMLAWWRRRRLARLRLEGPDLPDAVAERLRRLAVAGLRAHVFDMTSDFRVPSVFCLLQGPRRPFTIASAVVAADPAAACAKALDEAMMVRTAQVRGGADAVVASFERFDWIQTLEDHANLYAAWRDSPALAFLLNAGAPELAWPEFRDRDWWPAPRSLDDLAALARRLEGRGLTPLWCDLGPDDARPLGVCVKVVVPEMLPLAIGQRIRWLATPRLLAAGGSPGINPDPHPFP
jgi:ribosomal protein S12 methylthiotransferase accessory factor